MMEQEVSAEVLQAFTAWSPDLPDHDAGIIRVEKAGDGLINASYKVFCELKPDIFLQRINTRVFQRPQDLQSNYIQLWEYAEFAREDAVDGFTGIRLPTPVYLNAHHTLYRDESGGYWRGFELIEHSKTIQVVQKASQAKAVARAFAKFTAAFSEMDIGVLKNVIPGFHDLSLRYSQFEEALQTELYERMAETRDMVQELKNRERYKHFYEVILESGEFPQRVMHHDAKIGNVLFHEKTGKVICLVDFDTVMPGYFFSDLGDMIRSMAGSHDEGHANLSDLHIRKDFYQAIVDGYTSVLGGAFTAAENKYIHSAGLLMIYMQALRFLTDYLNGDQYYKTDHPGQNLERARNQLTLLQRLEEFLAREYHFRV
ncbi:MAG: aminoglycoside phosphotransferase family protein [Chitinophagaceae bacterium]